MNICELIKGVYVVFVNDSFNWLYFDGGYIFILVSISVK